MNYLSRNGVKFVKFFQKRLDFLFLWHYIALQQINIDWEQIMQEKIVGFVNEAISINSKILNQSISSGIESSQSLMQQASNQVADWFAVTSFDDCIARQTHWNELTVEQAHKSAEALTEIGAEAYNAYMALWQKTVEPARTTATLKKTAA